ncbi:putative transposase [Aminobacter sp. J44]|nr:putative transposase [Aminobacter sp. J44]
MAIEKELLDQLLAGRDPNEVFARDGLLDDLKKALSERILNTELDEHLEDERVEGVANRRNGHSRKSVLTGTSKMTLSIPRDRSGTFDPKLIAKYQRRFPDFDAKIISMYARGMTVREIRGHLEELYGIDVSPDLISAVTDAVLDEVAEWQNRPLDICYPLVFFDAIRVKIRDEGFVRNKAVYIALGILPDGTKEILGIWIEQTEGAKFWLRVMNELKNRGVGDILIAVVDGLKGFPEAINAVFPQTVVQTCCPHMHRASDPSFPGVRVVEGSQARRAGAARDLPGQGCRSRHEGPRGLRGRLLGSTISGNHPKLAAQLEPSRAVLRLSRKRAPDYLHHERHRGADFEAAPRRSHPGTLPH